MRRIRDLVDHIVADGQLSQDERRQLEEAVTEDPELSQEERDEIGRIVRMIESGLLKLTD
jgi:tellurite resistance protein